MLIVNDREQTDIVRELALGKLKELSKDLSDFIFNWIDEIEELSSKWPMEFPNGYNEDEANERMNIIGQNGPTGVHYNKNQTELEL
tara:strand:+ start:95 stop:352 length:258 start_codon:yes stop_codon:yes gene_type:complete